MLRAISVVLFLFVIASEIEAQPSTYPLYQTVYGSQYYNPDSVRVDTATGSSTYEHLFAKGYFGMFFSYHVIPLDSVSEDSVLSVGVSGIDTTYSAIMSALEGIQLKYGTITFRKEHPQIGDSGMIT